MSRTGFTRSAVSIGVFDGVHIGHRALLSLLQSQAAARDITPVVLTFDRLPEELIAPSRAPFRINTLEQKLQFLSEAGAARVVVSPFDNAVAELSPEEFVDVILLGELRAEVVVVGVNFRFGRSRAGNIDTLRQLGDKKGFSVISVEPTTCRGSSVSSTRVRHAVANGDLTAAAKLLGSHFTIRGRVVRGLGIGKQIGYPTANVQLSSRQILPMDGVYAVRARINGIRVPGVCSIGSRPTFGGGERSVEVMLYNFDGDIYGCEIDTEFHRKIRDQVKFDSVDALKKQIGRDIEEALEFVGTRVEMTSAG